MVVPARNDAQRLTGLLTALADVPAVVDLLVVDDESTDGTGDVARHAGATVVAGAPTPAGWARDAWALQQGLRLATGDWVVFLGAGARPSPHLPQALVGRALDDDLDIVSAAGRVDGPPVASRWLHHALMTTFGDRNVPGAVDQGSVQRRFGNGECMAVHRSILLRAGGFRPVAQHVVADVALVRMMATAGFATAYLDARNLLIVRPPDSVVAVWRHWARSLFLPGLDSRARQVTTFASLLIAQVVPLIRLGARRADALDVAMVAGRVAAAIGAASARDREGATSWRSSTADLAAHTSSSFANP